MVVITAALPATEAADAAAAIAVDDLGPSTEHLTAVALQAQPAPAAVGLSSSPARKAKPRKPRRRVAAGASGLLDCAQPTGRVPLSAACARSRAAPLLPAMRAPRNLPEAVVAVSKATREVARRRDKQRGAKREEQKKPPSAVAVPVGTAQDESLAAGGGSAGGAAGSTATLRIVAIHQTLSPLRPPSTFLQTPVPDFAPTGELDGPPTARPG